MATTVSTAVLKAVPLFSTFPEDQLRMLTTVPAYVAVGLWFVFQLISAFGVIGQGPQSGGGVAFMAHIGGFIAGAALTKGSTAFKPPDIEYRVAVAVKPWVPSASGNCTTRSSGRRSSSSSRRSRPPTP